uniref:EamA domain-containing protein n=1 Tax=Branchiostoma floridae TaxID=7739 RepID=C3YZN6_BRAFL|eukprot:XP_002598295.1 hypothetical protein BRAFLDRAFT_69650 [Branchiostoma floridae]
MATAIDEEETIATEGVSFTKTYLKSGAGVLYALLYTALSAFSAQFMTLSSQAGIPGLQLNFINKFGQFLLVLVALPVFKPKLTAENGRQALFFILWTITDNLGAVLGFMSFVFVVPGIAFGIIRGSMPFLTACLGFLLLKETVGVVDCFGIVLSVSGVVAVAVGMITENTSSTQRLTTSILLPLASAFSKGPNTVIARSLVGVQGVSILTIIFYANLLGAVVLLPLTYIVETGQRWEMSAQTAGSRLSDCACATTAHHSRRN